MEIETNQAQKEGEMMKIKMSLQELMEKTSERHDGTAVDAFKDNQNTITQQMAYIDAQLTAMSQDFSGKPKDWGFVGNQSYVMEQLGRILEFLGEVDFTKITDPAADGRRAARESGE